MMDLQHFSELLDDLQAEYNQIKAKLFHQWHTGESYSTVLPEIIKHTLTDALLYNFLKDRFVCFRKLISDKRYDEYLSQRNKPAGEMPHGAFIGVLKPVNPKPRFRGLEIRFCNIAQFERKAAEAFLMIREALPDTAPTDTAPEPEGKPAAYRHPEEIREIATRAKKENISHSEKAKLETHIQSLPEVRTVNDQVKVVLELNPYLSAADIAWILTIQNDSQVRQQKAWIHRHKIREDYETITKALRTSYR